MDRIQVRPAHPQAAPLSTASAERLDRLFHLYSSRVLAYAATRAKRPADADDIAGLAWVKACVTVHRLTGPDSAALPWLMCITYRAAATYYAPKRADEQPQDWTDATVSFSLPTAPPADESADVLALAELTAQQARCVKLAAQGLSHSAIAARIGRSHGAVYSHIHRGARKLRSSLLLAG